MFSKPSNQYQQETRILNQRVNIPQKINHKGFSYQNIPLPKILSKTSKLSI